MVREDLIEGAVTFLQDPSVANAPLEQRVAFLRSKNLTQDEIDASLARVGQAAPQTTYSNQQQQQTYRPPPQQQQYGGNYNNFQQPPYWSQPPPELPRRDWRDWFIMATVVGGAGYGLYWTAKRYVYPLIAPPTPPQLEQDKSHIDASFDKAFALLDQLATDTQELKDAEKQRTERLDRAVNEVEAVLGRLKEANEARELESKRVAREVADIREQIPRAIEREKETTDGRLKDLALEMKSLKTLVANRMAQPGSTAALGQRPPVPAGSPYATQQSMPSTNGINGISSTSTSTPVAQADTNGTSSTPTANGMPEDGKDVSNLLSSSSSTSDRASSTSTPSATPSYGASRLLGGKAKIPDWQLQAKKRSEEAAAARKEGSASANASVNASGATTPAAVQDVAQSGTVSGEGEVTA